jgi:hypothetical protein
LVGLSRVTAKLTMAPGAPLVEPMLMLIPGSPAVASRGATVAVTAQIATAHVRNESVILPPRKRLTDKAISQT